MTIENQGDHKIELREVKLEGPKAMKICGSAGSCVSKGVLTDAMATTQHHAVEKRFEIDGNKARVYDPASKKMYDYIRVDASMKKGFVFTFGNEPKQ